LGTAKAEYRKRELTMFSKKRSPIWFLAIQVVPLIVFVIAWQIVASCYPKSQFIFSSPIRVGTSLVNLIVSLELFSQAGITASEAIAGFFLGTGLGAVLGLSLWYSTAVARIARPYVIAIGSLPVFVLAPVMITWFGIGIFSKIMMATLSTVVVAIVQAYQGATSVEDRHLRLMEVMKATRTQIFFKVVVPSSLIWVVNSMKLNVGFALLGAFIGEFISSEKGLGYMIIKAAGLYDMATVFSGCLAIIAIALALTFGVQYLERKLLAWRYASE
jgi:NitT/TauT family transport system permease protein